MKRNLFIGTLLLAATAASAQFSPENYEAMHSEEICDLVNGADLVLPDGGTPPRRPVL